MEEHPNGSIVRQACIALGKADAAAIQTLFAESAELRVAGRSAISGRYTGPTGVEEYARKRLDLSGGTFKSIVHDIVAGDRHNFAIERFRAKRLDRRLDVRSVTVLHVFDGCVAGGIQLSEDPYVEDEFWQ